MSYARKGYRHNRRIETSREGRLWLERIIFPAALLTAVAVTRPDLIGKIKHTFTRGGTSR